MKVSVIIANLQPKNQLGLKTKHQSEYIQGGHLTGFVFQRIQDELAISYLHVQCNLTTGALMPEF
jgi:hypothetical protein